MTIPIDDAALRILIADVAARAARRGSGPPCLALPSRLTVSQIERSLAGGQLSGLVIDASSEVIGDPRVGMILRPGDWRLPNGVGHSLYFAGSARSLGRGMVREAARHGVRVIALQVRGHWIELPLAPLVRLKAPARWIATRALVARERFGGWRGRIAQGLVKRFPAVAPVAKRIGGRAGLHASPMEAAFRALIVAPPVGPARPIEGRVIHVIGSLSPGGAERQAAMTASGLKAAGRADVHILCHTLASGPPHHHDFHRARAERVGVVVSEIERRFSITVRSDWPPAIARADRDLPADLLVDIANLHAMFVALRPAVVHAWLDWDGVRAGVAAVLAGVPRVIVSGRNLNPSRFVFHQPTMRPAYRALIDHPSVRFLNNSRAGADDYARWLHVDPARIDVIANAVAFEGLDPPSKTAERAARERFGLPRDAPVIGGVFRFAPEKRPLLWLDMAARLNRLRPDVHFILFGMGPLEAAMRRRAARLGLDDRLGFAGVTADVAEAMAAMDILVLTSSDEGLPNVVLEAQALGRPVVTTRAGGVAEAMRDGVTGVIVDDASPEALARAVERVLVDHDWRAGARVVGPEFTRATFSTERMVNATIDVYDDGATSNRG